MNCKNIAFLLCIFVCFNVGKSDNHLHDCPNSTLYDPNSNSGRTYRNNLNFLLSVLVSNASQPNRFYNFTAGTVNPAYGLFECRGDIKASECLDCLTKARSEVFGLCPDVKSVTVWYDHCMLRYSNQSIFSKLDTSVTKIRYNTGIIDDTAVWKQVLGDAFDQIATRAAYDVSGKKFAVQEGRYSPLQKLFALGQCTPDLSSLDCERCLRDSFSQFPQCCSKHQGGVVITPSCNIRHETYPFYEVASPPPAGPPNLPPPRPPSLPVLTPGNSTGKVQISTQTIVAIVIPTFVAIVAVFVVVFCIVRRGKEKKTGLAESAIDETTGTGTITTNEEYSLRYK